MKKFPGNNFLIRFFTLFIGLIFISFLMALQMEAIGLEVILSQQITISCSEGVENGSSLAFDWTNNRFIVVWTDNYPIFSSENNIYGQLVDGDGKLFGSRINICEHANTQQLDPRVAFNGSKFLVVWADNREGIWLPYARSVGTDGSTGTEFRVDPFWGYDPVYTMYPLDVVSYNSGFLVLLSGRIDPENEADNNVYVKFVSSDGSPTGNIIRVTDYNIPGTYGSHGGNIAYGNGCFLIAWNDPEDRHIHGRIMSENGDLSEKFTISTNVPPEMFMSNSCGDISYDPINNRFLVTWGTAYYSIIRGQLVNTNGTLYGNELEIAEYPAIAPSTTFDASVNKYVMVGKSSEGFGQIINLDGSLYGSKFTIYPSSWDGAIPSIAFGAKGIGTLAVWSDVNNIEHDRDIFGKFIKLAYTNENNPPVALDDAYKTTWQTPLVVSSPGVLGNDTDVDGDKLTIIGYSTTSQFEGKVTMNTDGSFTYTPNDLFIGEDTFSYTISDGHSGIATATVKVTVNSKIKQSISVVMDGFTPEDTEPKNNIFETINGSFLLTNTSKSKAQPNSVQIMDMQIGVEVKAGNKGAYKKVELISCVFTPSPKFVFEENHLVTYKCLLPDNVIKVGDNVRVTAYVDVFDCRTSFKDSFSKLITGVSAAPILTNDTPSITNLGTNYPNPFNPDTWIPYQLANSADITIRIYDVSGKLIRVLELGNKSAGFYTTKDKAAYWDGKNEAGEQTSSGIYFYTIQAGDFVATKKMVVKK